ncbi:hypothetical protein KAR48_15105 [bacterium]|nr:hypothetical protein [bacterium]
MIKDNTFLILTGWHKLVSLFFLSWSSAHHGYLWRRLLSEPQMARIK